MNGFKHAGLSSATALAILFTFANAQAGQVATGMISGESPVIRGQSLVEASSHVVSIADLNLSHPAGMKALHGRIKLAVNIVCGQANIRDVLDVRDNRECRANAFADAMTQVEAAMALNGTSISEVRVAAR